MQPVLNYYKALTHTTAYFSKSESELSESLKKAAREIINQNLNVQEAMKKIAYSLISTCQLYVQGVVYNVLLELWLWKYLPGVSFISTNLPQNKIGMIAPKEELKELSDDSTVVFKGNIIDKYIDRLYKNCLSCAFHRIWSQKMYFSKWPTIVSWRRH